MVNHTIYIKPGDTLTVQVSDTNTRSTTAPRSVNNYNNDDDDNNTPRINLSKGGKKTRKASGGKRELSGYMKFSRKMRPEILRANPGMEFAAVGKRLGEEWRKLSDADKKKY
jgi:hypothetical protein